MTKHLSRKRRRKMSRQGVRALERHFDDLWKLCRCIPRYRPCEGLQAGGLCDELGLVPDWSEE